MHADEKFGKLKDCPHNNLLSSYIAAALVGFLQGDCASGLENQGKGKRMTVRLYTR